jgi:hypothetical protein
MFRLLSALTAVVTAATTITSCGSTSTRLQLTALDFQPTNPVPGSDVFMTVEFQNPGIPVTDGKAHRKVTLNGLPVVDETVALCGEATECPLATGFNNRSAPSTWPDVTGKIVSTIQWLDLAGAELLCIKTSVTTVRPRLRGVPRASTEAVQHLTHSVFSHSKALTLIPEAPLVPAQPFCWASNQSADAPEWDAASE